MPSQTDSMNKLPRKQNKQKIPSGCWEGFVKRTLICSVPVGDTTSMFTSVLALDLKDNSTVPSARPCRVKGTLAGFRKLKLGGALPPELKFATARSKGKKTFLRVQIGVVQQFTATMKKWSRIMNIAVFAVNLRCSGSGCSCTVARDVSLFNFFHCQVGLAGSPSAEWAYTALPPRSDLVRDSASTPVRLGPGPVDSARAFVAFVGMMWQRIGHPALARVNNIIGLDVYYNRLVAFLSYVLWLAIKLFLGCCVLAFMFTSSVFVYYKVYHWIIPQLGVPWFGASSHFFSRAHYSGLFPVSKPVIFLHLDRQLTSSHYRN